MSERDTPNEADAPLVGTPPGDAAAPMRLRAEPPRVTRLSRKVLDGISPVAALLCTSDPQYPLPRHLARPILDAQNRGQRV